MRTATLAVAIVVLSVSTYAGEPASDRQRWIAEALEALGSDDAEVRHSARAALRRLGRRLVPSLVSALPDRVGDGFWTALESVLAELNRKQVVMQLEAGASAWPTAHAPRLRALVSRLRRADNNDDIRKGVAGILREFAVATEFGAHDPRIDLLVGYGRDALPHLLKALRHGVYRAGYADEAAAEALSRMITNDDVVKVADLLSAGHLIAAPALRRLDSDDAMMALLEPIRRGFVSHQLLDQLARFSDKTAVRDTLIGWLRDKAVPDSTEMGAVAAFCGRHGYLSARPLLSRHLARTKRTELLVEVGDGLARLGGTDGIRALLAVFIRPATGPVEQSVRHAAGVSLNWVVGERVFLEAGPLGAGGSENFPHAVKWFRTWWDKHRDSVRFDSAKRRWVWRS